MSAFRELPKYKCHKEVWALEIKGIETTFDAALVPQQKFLHFHDQGYAPIEATDFIAKHKPEQGGYYVQYEDGYTSYSPAKAFKEGYSPIK